AEEAKPKIGWVKPRYEFTVRRLVLRPYRPEQNPVSIGQHDLFGKKLRIGTDGETVRADAGSDRDADARIERENAVLVRTQRVDVELADFREIRHQRRDLDEDALDRRAIDSGMVAEAGQQPCNPRS